MTFNQTQREYENIQENRRSREAEDDDRRQEGEDVELENVHPVMREILQQYFKRRGGK